MAVSGCPRNCAESTVKDVGVDSHRRRRMGESSVGGAAGAHVRKTDVLCRVQDEGRSHSCDRPVPHLLPRQREVARTHLRLRRRASASRTAARHHRERTRSASTPLNSIPKWRKRWPLMSIPWLERDNAGVCGPVRRDVKARALTCAVIPDANPEPRALPWAEDAQAFSLQRHQSSRRGDIPQPRALPMGVGDAGNALGVRQRGQSLVLMTATVTRVSASVRSTNCRTVSAARLKWAGARSRCSGRGATATCSPSMAKCPHKGWAARGRNVDRGHKWCARCHAFKLRLVTPVRAIKPSRLLRYRSRIRPKFATAQSSSRCRCRECDSANPADRAAAAGAWPCARTARTARSSAAYCMGEDLGGPDMLARVRRPALPGEQRPVVHQGLDFASALLQHPQPA